MFSIVAKSARTVLLSLLIAAPGCTKSVERSSSAVALPPVAHDEREQPASEENWPGWRGTNTSGVAADSALPVRWSTDSGIRWKQKIPGRGNSSPVIWGDHVLLTSALGAEEGSQLMVYSLDRRSGEQRWEAEASKSLGGTHPKNGFASASVTTDGKQVFASFGSAGLYAFDLQTGQRNWNAELGTLEHEWGSASSPALIGNLVIQLCDSAANSELKAFDKTSGELVWRTSRRSYGSWSTPVLVTATDDAGQTRPELIINGTGTSSGNGEVVAYDPASGKELWTVRGTTEVVCPTAILGSNLVVSTSGRNGPIIAIKPGGSGDVTKTNVVWKHPTGGAYVPTGVAYRNRLYTIADGGLLACFNLGDGEQIWRQRLKGSYTASLIAGAGQVYATDEYGVVHVFAAKDNFEPLASNDLQERTFATPAAVEGQLFLRTEDHLYCIGGATENTSASAQ
jgi:outer membrane protein assembly factor BamB